MIFLSELLVKKKMKLIKIIKKEYLTIVKKKSFLISTLLTPLIMGAFIILPIIFAQISPEMHKKIAVIDFTGEIFQELTKNLNRKLKTGEPAYKLFEIKTTENEVEKVKESLREKVEKKEYYGYLILNKEIISKREAEYYSKNVSDLQTIEELKAAISDSIAKLLLQKEGIELEKIKKAMKRIELKTIKIVKGKEKKAGFLSEYFGLIFLVSLLFALILGYGMTIMRNILEEKNSRIVEVLLSSTNSFELMMGKILGIGGAGITQMVIWALLIALSIRYFSFRFPQIEFTIFGTNILIFFFIFFILGFFLFSTLFAIIGAITNTDYEAQQLAAPITWILIIPFLIAIIDLPQKILME